MRIGIDIMGGDFAPQKTIEGTVLSMNEIASGTEIVLFGIKEKILEELKKHNVDKDHFEIIDCSSVIEMGENPTKALKSKPRSSLSIGFKYLAEGKIDGFASAGNTGAMFVGGYYSVQAVSGVLRPAICTLLPREDGGKTVILDVGANADCKPDVLFQFGLLGSIFSQNVCNIQNPKVSLLNVGEEKTKGNKVTQSAYTLMENNKQYNFIGNIEGRDIFDSKSDVIVCDGFTGNIVLKEAEAFYKIIKKRNINDVYFNKFNYENYGGTPILGLNKTVIIGHGISSAYAIKNMIKFTVEIVNANLKDKIENSIIK